MSNDMMNRKRVLCDAIDRYSRLYYYTGQTVATDQQFDALLKELKEIDPNNIRVTRVGFPIPEDTMLQKFKHTVRTNSLAKADSEDDLRKWYRKMGGGRVIVELKADGMTLVLYYENGVLDRGVTRGGDDGIGEDVTRNVAKFQGVPKTLPVPFTGGIRGETIVLTKDAQFVDPDYGTDNPGNIRNIGNGIVQRTDSTQSEYISFLAFNYEKSPSSQHPLPVPSTEQEKLGFLHSSGFNVINYCLCENIDDAITYWKIIEQKRRNNELPYKIDGIVFKIDDVATHDAKGYTKGRPNAEIVLKFDAPGDETFVEGVVLTVGHRGDIKPTASLKPVFIDNTWVKSAQLNNWSIIEAMDVAIGDTVRVIKAKDIIPQIVEVVHRPTNRIPIPRPTECPDCGGPVGLRENTDGSEGIETECKNPDCAGKTIKRIANWIEKNSILGIGDVVLEALSDQLGIETPADLYRLTVESLANLDMDNGKYGESRARMVYDNIQKTRRKMTLRQFLGSLSIRFLGRRRVEMIQEKCPGQMDTLADWQSDKLLTLNAGVDNMAPVILEDIRKHKALIEDLLKYIEIVNDDSNKNDGGNGMTTAKGNELSGKTFVFTGKILSTDAEGNRYTREMLHYKVMDHSGNVDTKIKASTEGNQYYLVQADPNSTSTKTMDAKKKGATIISETDFWTMINEQPGSGSAAVD